MVVKDALKRHELGRDEFKKVAKEAITNVYKKWRHFANDEKKRGKRVTITEFLTHKVRKRVDTMVEKYIKVLP